MSKHPFEFEGSATEYFRIWIVNIILTILTIGIYSAWATVRNKRYFYVNTRLGDDPFDYLADPKRLLYGYLILVGFLACYNYLPTINPLLSLPVLVVGIIGFPWVIYKSRRFFCRNSAFRNVRYRFTGTLGEAYASYLGIPLLVPFTLGLAQPYVFFRQKETNSGNCHRATAVTPNMVNLVVLGGHLIVPKPLLPGFEAAVEDALLQGSVQGAADLLWVDTFHYLHKHDGNIHCATSQRYTPPATPWWRR